MEDEDFPGLQNLLLQARCSLSSVLTRSGRIVPGCDLLLVCAAGDVCAREGGAGAKGQELSRRAGILAART